jgi:hypothetical protein
MLARLRKLPALLLNFVEQPHGLDRDHRLVRKRGNQLDLLLGERTRNLTDQDHDADGRSIAQQRHAQHGTIARILRRPASLLLM